MIGSARSVGDLDTPVALVEIGRLEANLSRMAKAVGDAGTALRPHTKSHKTREVAERQLALGAAGLTVAKVGEAEALAHAGFDDLFIAYPVLGDNKFRRLLRLMDRARIRIALDSADVARAVSAYFSAAGRTLGVLIEIDSGFGRCGVQSVDEVLALAEVIADLPGVDLEGVMGFGGHVYDTSDAAEQASIGRAEGRQAADAARALRGSGRSADVVSVGSTPTARWAAGVEGVTEVRPGVYAFYDLKQVSLGVASLDDCALTVRATVVSHPRPERYVVDAGLKALAGEDYGWGTYGRLLEFPDVVVSWAAEEHGVIDVPADVPDPKLAIGDRVRIVPNHACGTVNMHDDLVAVDGERVIDVWPVIGRGRFR